MSQWFSTNATWLFETPPTNHIEPLSVGKAISHRARTNLGFVLVDRAKDGNSARYRLERFSLIIDNDKWQALIRELSLVNIKSTEETLETDGFETWQIQNPNSVHNGYYIVLSRLSESAPTYVHLPIGIYESNVFEDYSRSGEFLGHSTNEVNEGTFYRTNAVCRITRVVKARPTGVDVTRATVMWAPVNCADIDIKGMFK